MKIEFIRVKWNGPKIPPLKELMWTGDLGMPIPRKGELIAFYPEGAEQIDAVVVAVLYRIRAGIGQSVVEVRVKLKADYDKDEMRKMAKRAR